MCFFYVYVDTCSRVFDIFVRLLQRAEGLVFGESVEYMVEQNVFWCFTVIIGCRAGMFVPAATVLVRGDGTGLLVFSNIRLG